MSYYEAKQQKCKLPLSSKQSHSGQQPKQQHQRRYGIVRGPYVRISLRLVVLDYKARIKNMEGEYNANQLP